MNALYIALVLGVALSLGYLAQWIWGLVKRRRRKMEIHCDIETQPYTAPGDKVGIRIADTHDLMKLQVQQQAQLAMVHKTQLAARGLGFFGGQPQAVRHTNKPDIRALSDSLNMHPALHSHLQAGRESVKQQLVEWLEEIAEELGAKENLLEMEKKLHHEYQTKVSVLSGKMEELKKKLVVQQRFLASIGGLVEMQVNLLPMDLDDNGKPLGNPTRFTLGPHQVREVLRLYWDMVADEVDAKIGRGRKTQLTDADMESTGEPEYWTPGDNMAMIADFKREEERWLAHETSR
jgi:hypothetical protein